MKVIIVRKTSSTERKTVVSGLVKKQKDAEYAVNKIGERIGIGQQWTPKLFRRGKGTVHGVLYEYSIADVTDNVIQYDPEEIDGLFEE